MNKFVWTLAASTLLASSGLAFAQTPDASPTPRVDQVEQHLQNQETRVNNAEAAGKITPAQAAKDDAKDAKVADKLSKDEAKHNGHITKGEQKHLNKKLDKNGKKITHQEKKNGTLEAPAQ